MPTPIFVIGPHRSGTTWLANILCRHTQVTGIQSTEHKGIHESAFFSHVDRHFGKLDNENAYIEFVEVFSSSDYFSLSGLKKELLYAECPREYGEVFRLVMDKYADANDADNWVEKTPAHTLYLDKIHEYFPEGKYLGITRELTDVVRSSVAKRTFRSKLQRMLFIFRQVIHVLKYQKHISYFKDRIPNMKVIRYEELNRDKNVVIQKICDFLDLRFEERLLEEHFSPNTSFEGPEKQSGRKEVFSQAELGLIRLLSAIFSLVPFFGYRSLHILQDRLRSVSLPSWFWKVHKKTIDFDG